MVVYCLGKYVVSPLVVPKIVCSLFTSHNFDHYVNSHSLYRPQGAVVFLAPLGKGGKASLILNLTVNQITHIEHTVLFICDENGCVYCTCCEDGA